MSTPITKLGPDHLQDRSDPLNGMASDVVENGLLLTDMSLDVIAFDAGAAGIFRDAPQLGSSKIGEQSLKIPDEIRTRLAGVDLSKVTPTNISLKIGKCTYICRAVVVHPKNGAVKPMVVFYFRRDASVIDVIRAQARRYHLSERETQALEAIATGQSSKEAAHQMKISPNTVKSFTRIIMIKMQVDTKAAIIAKLLDYYRNG